MASSHTLVSERTSVFFMIASLYTSTYNPMKSKNEKELLDSEIALQKAALRTVRTLLEGERIGYNNALHWAADWITNAATANGSPDVIAFAQNMAMSFNAHKKQGKPLGFAITPAAGFDVTAALKERGEWPDE